jgi:hypothetical protein
MAAHARSTRRAPRKLRAPGRPSALRALRWCAVALVLAGAPAGCGAGAGAGHVWPPGGSRIFSPYVDVGLAAPSDLAGVATDAGARSLTLAFVTAAAGGCEPSWGGATPIGAGSVAGPAARLRAAGVALRVSFGGALGTELAERCPDVGSLEAAYASVLHRYHAVAADFDLEGAALADRPAMARRAQAIARLQARGSNPPAVSLTLPVSPRGLSASALAAVREMIAAGVRPASVNLLAMDYGLPQARGHMAQAAILALGAAHRQLGALSRGLAGWGSLGVTVMVGANDVSGEVLTLADARSVARFAERRGLGLTSIWSLARDGPCAGSPTAAGPTCSGVSEPPYAFSRAFGARSNPAAAVRRAVDAS